MAALISYASNVRIDLCFENFTSIFVSIKNNLSLWMGGGGELIKTLNLAYFFPQTSCLIKTNTPFLGGYVIISRVPINYM